MMYEIDELMAYHFESEYLDFKREEYNDQNKPNLIKDVMAFANANTPGDKYIIIGVDKKGGETELIPIEPKLDSANIQQYIHDNIEPELDIAYFPYEFKGTQLMVLQIKDANSKPYFTSKPVSFKNGKVLLKANECWIRKGSYQMTATRSDLEKIYEARKATELSKLVEVTFEDGTTAMTAAPKFVRYETTYQNRRQAREWNPAMDMMEFASRKSVVSYTSEKMYNHSFFSFNLILHNTGQAAIDDCKLYFEFSGPVQEINTTNYVSGGLPEIITNHPSTPKSTILDYEQLKGKIIPPSSPLVSEEIFESKRIFVKAHPDCTELKIKWKLISRHHKQEGTLEIQVEPEIIPKSKVIVSVTDKERTEKGDVEDYIAALKG